MNGSDAIAKVARLLKRQPAVIGYVETLEPTKIAGWVVRRDGKPVSRIVLEVDGKSYPMLPTWTERSDVAQQHGQFHLFSGFSCKVPHEAEGPLLRALRGNEKITVNADAWALKIVSGAQHRPSQAEPVADAVSRRGSSSYREQQPGGGTEVLQEARARPTAGPADDTRALARMPEAVRGLLAENILATLTGKAARHAAEEAATPDWIGVTKFTSALYAKLEWWGFFCIRGWAIAGDRGVRTATLTCGDEPAIATLIPLERLDIAEDLEAKDANFGFEITIPATVWSLVPSGEDLMLGVELDGVPITDEPILLTRARVAQWVEQALATRVQTKIAQFWAMLALEHVHFGGLWELLTKGVRESLRTFAEEMNLEDFLPKEATEEEEGPRPIADVNTLILWDAMRRLNERLLKSNRRGSVYPDILAVFKRERFTEEARRWFLNLAVQLTCETDEFEQLRALIDLRRFRELASSDRPEHVSLALPALVSDAYYDEACNALRKLRRYPTESWIHTVCIRYSVEQLSERAADGVADQGWVEKFGWELFALLDAFHGDWFSRLHDRELIRAIVALFDHADSYTDYFRRDLVAAALRHYGLIPEFWALLSAKKGVVGSVELEQAAGHWKNIRGVIESWDSRAATDPDVIEGQMARLVESILWFQARRNPDALIVLREVVMNGLPGLNAALGKEGRRAVEALLRGEWGETLRVLGFPFGTVNRLQDRFPETSGEAEARVRSLAGCHRSAAYQTQVLFGQLLTAANAAGARRDVRQMRDAASALERKAAWLSNWQGAFLGVELLTTAYELGLRAGDDGTPLLGRVFEDVSRCIAETKDDYYLPAPVLAAIQRLERLPPAPLSDAVRAEIREAVSRKFSDRHADVVTADEPLAIECGGYGWPRDTLVMIFSRTDREDRQSAIRDAWVADLKSRQIPYLFVVGGGADAVEADVLSLALPDDDHDAVRKALASLFWALTNTDAQFVLKVDDDCYLDVPNYFETLSYRKHHYYGKLVRRGVGSLERLDRTESGFLAAGIRDKSPEPSLYACGRTGYSLSRLGITKLKEATGWGDGVRIIASSTRPDKAVGDLLALQNIFPSDEDFFAVERNADAPATIPVSLGEHGFLPNRLSQTKTVRAQRLEEMGNFHALSRGDELWPKKIWPTCWTPSIRHNSNQLELMTESARAAALLRNPVVVVAVIRNEMLLLRHFLAHYRAMGVPCFVFVDNCSTDGSREYLESQPDVVLYATDTEYRKSHYGVAWQQAVLGNHCLGKWVILADADEFLVYERSETRPLVDYIEELEAVGSDSVLLHMIDMYPYGDLDEACFETNEPFAVANYFDKAAQIELKFGGGQFSNSRNYVNGLRHRLAPSRINAYVSQKYALFKYKPWMRFSEGIHYAANIRSAGAEAWYAHFKYHAGFKTKVTEEIRRKQHFNAAEEYQRYAAMLSEVRGGFGSGKLSEKYRGSASFMNATGRRA
jgi:hypothetical protein